LILREDCKIRTIFVCTVDNCFLTFRSTRRQHPCRCGLRSANHVNAIARLRCTSMGLRTLSLMFSAFRFIILKLSGFGILWLRTTKLQPSLLRLVVFRLPIIFYRRSDNPHGTYDKVLGTSLPRTVRLHWTKPRTTQPLQRIEIKSYI
jgi:hypothetical protein